MQTLQCDYFIKRGSERTIIKCYLRLLNLFWNCIVAGLEVSSKTMLFKKLLYRDDDEDDS